MADECAPPAYEEAPQKLQLPPGRNPFLLYHDGKPELSYWEYAALRGSLENVQTVNGQKVLVIVINNRIVETRNITPRNTIEFKGWDDDEFQKAEERKYDDLKKVGYHKRGIHEYYTPERYLFEKEGYVGYSFSTGAYGEERIRVKTKAGGSGGYRLHRLGDVMYFQER